MIQAATINHVKTFPVKGPWKTKSNGNLDVLSIFSHEQLQEFFCHDREELTRVGKDIRGLRIYRVSNLKKHAVGGMEWHRIKQELVVVTKGSVVWNLKDHSGAEREVTLTPHNETLLIPPHILHTYTAIEDNSEIIVITNTLYDPDDPKTYDTYPPDVF